MRSKGKLITQWFTSVLVILLVISAIAIPFNIMFNSGGDSSSKDDDSIVDETEESVRLDKEIIIF